MKSKSKISNLTQKNCKLVEKILEDSLKIYEQMRQPIKIISPKEK